MLLLAAIVVVGLIIKDVTCRRYSLTLTLSEIVLFTSGIYTAVIKLESGEDVKGVDTSAIQALWVSTPWAWTIQWPSVHHILRYRRRMLSAIRYMLFSLYSLLKLGKESGVQLIV